MKKCLDEATIQAYADGELSAAPAEAAGAHLARCAACAAALAEVEQANAFFASAFAPAADVVVPSEVLRARVSAAVAGLEAPTASPARRASGWDFGALLAPFTGLFSFAPQRAAAFASVLALVAFGVVFYAVRQRTETSAPPQLVAQIDNPATPSGPHATPVAPSAATGSTPAETGPAASPGADAVKASQRAPAVKVSAPRRANAARRPASNTVASTPAPAAEALVPGEKNYREAIASLEKVVEVGGDSVLAPRARIDYERNLAVLDRAIEETRRAALRNPKDRDAVGFLMSTYQSKLELLSTVAEQAQVAAAGR